MFACGVRTVVIYLVLIAAVRLMGKRQIGQLEASEFVVTMLAANLAALPIEDPEFSMTEGITAIVVIVILAILPEGHCSAATEGLPRGRARGWAACRQDPDGE